ncbi:hypothetical protein MPTK1_5g11960 [Marchantia polymorpha subsp. ruderalis]|uniref:Uncharacterized protein n=2 Tax=Marchantia polymorpha TaxID=3197 RepID=A0A176VJ00_MARPO|nr:hypothetical protein AXG93_3256s1750 [Marchantia polymorpha subsp. ruderalis]PTQ29345.1 hypothetical protein MARPO_0143s0025 [Marchantia polymorpha]BBN11446.1 hypothetical protein Mp_5g11960 [Marchantia polymorpha subsp. ruderalis]|eukprot:PTQ29345.1 hypothetical protein MARPO_0143s0025 [Marchantia polymorpha]
MRYRSLGRREGVGIVNIMSKTEEQVWALPKARSIVKSQFLGPGVRTGHGHEVMRAQYSAGLLSDARHDNNCLPIDGTKYMNLFALALLSSLELLFDARVIA